MKTLQDIFKDLQTEYDDCVRTYEKYPDSPVDQFCIIDQMNEDLHKVVPIDFATETLTIYRSTCPAGGHILMDETTVQKMITSMFLATQPKLIV